MLKKIEMLSCITWGFVNMNKLNLIALIVIFECTNTIVQLHYFLCINCIVFN